MWCCASERCRELRELDRLAGRAAVARLRRSAGSGGDAGLAALELGLLGRQHARESGLHLLRLGALLVRHRRGALLPTLQRRLLHLHACLERVAHVGGGRLGDLQHRLFVVRRARRRLRACTTLTDGVLRRDRLLARSRGAVGLLRCLLLLVRLVDLGRLLGDGVLLELLELELRLPLPHDEVTLLVDVEARALRLADRLEPLRPVAHDVGGHLFHREDALQLARVEGVIALLLIHLHAVREVELEVVLFRVRRRRDDEGRVRRLVHVDLLRRDVVQRDSDGDGLVLQVHVVAVRRHEAAGGGLELLAEGRVLHVGLRDEHALRAADVGRPPRARLLLFRDLRGFLRPLRLRRRLGCARLRLDLGQLLLRFLLRLRRHVGQ
mmetsp:Transcript_39375/g.121774  ORF Transcript_39375/g.121774 Transcript_39375/m.121774 type:complete len:381 (-) Transcript_39375:21-1163(-)